MSVQYFDDEMDISNICITHQGKRVLIGTFELIRMVSPNCESWDYTLKCGWRILHISAIGDDRVITRLAWNDVMIDAHTIFKGHTIFTQQPHVVVPFRPRDPFCDQDEHQRD